MLDQIVSEQIAQYKAEAEKCKEQGDSENEKVARIKAEALDALSYRTVDVDGSGFEYDVQDLLYNTVNPCSGCRNCPPYSIDPQEAQDCRYLEDGECVAVPLNEECSEWRFSHYDDGSGDY